jgi:nitroreductase
MSGSFYKAKRKYWYYRHRLHELVLCIKEFKAGSNNTAEAQEAAYKKGMLLQVHRIEKGLGLDSCEPGHSSDVAKDLIFRLENYISNGYAITDYAFQETFAVLNAYLVYQKSFGSPNWKPLKELENGFRSICEMIGEDTARNILEKIHAGSYEVEYDELNAGKSIDFDRLISSRHSIRMFSQKEITASTMENIVKLANKSPSACNRQPARVYFVKEQKRIKDVDSLITGNHGFEGGIPYYVILTEDRAQFSGEEQFQWYINGGIYLSYLSLAMHSVGIGNCIMQWKAFHKNEKQLKRTLGISGREAIIAIIGCGYYRENTKVICAERKDSSETLHVL